MKTKTLTLFILHCVFSHYSAAMQRQRQKKSSANLRVKSVKIVNEPNEPMVVGEKIKLLASVKPAKARYKKIIWTSSNKKVATISRKGTLRAKKKGLLSLLFP